MVNARVDRRVVVIPALCVEVGAVADEYAGTLQFAHRETVFACCFGRVQGQRTRRGGKVPRIVGYEIFDRAGQQLRPSLAPRGDSVAEAKGAGRAPRAWGLLGVQADPPEIGLVVGEFGWFVYR